MRNNLNPPVNEHEAARLIGVAVQSLRNWRHQRKGPAYLKISRSVRYRLEDLEDYINSKRVDPERTA